MVERRIRHEYFTPPADAEISGQERWFLRYRQGLANTIFAQEDIRFSRFVAAHMLLEAWDRDKFFQENGDMDPKPTEVDRTLMIAYLRALVSCSGLINGEEMREIQEKEGRVSLENYYSGDPELENYEELVSRAKEWKLRGLKIGLFHGSFDPPTVMHLACAAEAYQQCDRLIIGFDSDELVRSRKGQDRPRLPVIERRAIFGSFWPVDGTFVLRASNTQDVEAYADDYQKLGVNFVFLASNQEDIEERLNKIRLGGAEPRYLSPQSGQFSATKIVQLIKEREDCNK
jgi:cytidyltransferase-like protein